jgi:predicted nuclease of predicted toxin-antitoxin system
MSLRLLLDEDTQAKRLIRLLREAGHEVETATEAGLVHKADSQVLAHAKQQGRLVITRNCDDFAALHRASSEPPGVLAVYQHDTASDMSDADIVQAIANLERVSAETEWQFLGEFVVLNQWNYLRIARGIADE